MWNGLMCEWKHEDVFIIAVILHPAASFRQKRKQSEGNFEKFWTCISPSQVPTFWFIYICILDPPPPLFFQRTFTKKDGNTIKGIEMSTLVLRGFFGGGGMSEGMREGFLRWGGKKGLLGGRRENLLALQHHGQFRWGSLLPCSPRGPKLANRLCVCRDAPHSVRTARWMDMCP